MKEVCKICKQIIEGNIYQLNKGLHCKDCYGIGLILEDNEYRMQDLKDSLNAINWKNHSVLIKYMTFEERKIEELQKIFDDKEQSIVLDLRLKDFLSTTLSEYKEELLNKIEKEKEGSCKHCKDKVTNWNCKQHAILDIIQIIKES